MAYKNINANNKALIDFDYFKALAFPFYYLKISIYRFFLIVFCLELYFCVDLELLAKAFSTDYNYDIFLIFFMCIHFAILPIMWLYPSFKNKALDGFGIEYFIFIFIPLINFIYVFMLTNTLFNLLILSLIVHIVCYFLKLRAIYLFLFSFAIFIAFYIDFYTFF